MNVILVIPLHLPPPPHAIKVELDDSQLVREAIQEAPDTGDSIVEPHVFMLSIRCNGKEGLCPSIYDLS